MTLAEWKKIFTLKGTEEGIIIAKYKAKDTIVEIPSHIGDKPVFAIGDMAFKGKEIEEIVIPDTVKIIGERAFCDCKHLYKVVMPENVHTDPIAFYGCDRLADETGFVILNRTLFRYIGQDKNVKIPDYVEVIDQGALERCRFIESVVIPNSVQQIRNAAFFGCKKLSSVIIENSNAIIFPGAFDECEKLADSDGNIIFNDYLYQCNTNQSHVVIPSVVKRIGRQSMKYSSILQSMVVPDGVTTIEAFAFMNCSSNFETIELPGSITSIQANAFSLCKKLTITAPKGSYAIEYAKESNIPFIEV